MYWKSTQKDFYKKSGVGSVRCSFNGTGQMREPRRWNDNERFTLFLCLYSKKKNNQEGYFRLLLYLNGQTVELRR